MTRITTRSFSSIAKLVAQLLLRAIKGDKKWDYSVRRRNESIEDLEKHVNAGKLIKFDPVVLELSLEDGSNANYAMETLLSILHVLRVGGVSIWGNILLMNPIYL